MRNPSCVLLACSFNAALQILCAICFCDRGFETFNYQKKMRATPDALRHPESPATGGNCSNARQKVVRPIQKNEVINWFGAGNWSDHFKMRIVFRIVAGNWSDQSPFCRLPILAAGSRAIAAR
jgi:hypothetical protein